MQLLPEPNSKIYLLERSQQPANPRLATLLALADALGVAVAALLPD